MEVARILIETFLSAYAERKVSIKILATSPQFGAEGPTLGAGCPTLRVATQSRKGKPRLIAIYL